MSDFLFATGIECSYPTIPTKEGGRKRVDELAKCGHYERWLEDFELVKELGIRYLRYGGPYYRIHKAPGLYDWSFLDMTLPVLRQMGIEVMLDLCHFGVPDWVGDFQNEDWPNYFGEFAAEAARRYPWVNYFTPVNEIYIAALYSGQFGYWNEALTSERAFVRALVNLCRANVVAMNAIVNVSSNVQFVQSESTQYFHAEGPEDLDQAFQLNERRFLALDLSYAYPMTASMFRYLLENGMRQEEYDWFQAQSIRAHCIMGSDYYEGNEHLVSGPYDWSKPEPKKDTNRLDVVRLGFHQIANQYYMRYHLPMMHTETNMDEPNSVYWLRQNWAGAFRLREERVPLVGFTWYSLIDQVDWDATLSEDNGTINPRGLYDIDRKIRPVGEEYKKLIGRWREHMESEKVSLRESRW